MPYAPTDWVDGTTPLDEAHLDKIEQQLVLADGRVLFISNGEVINLDLATPPSLLVYYQIYPNGGGSIRSVGAPSSHGNRILLHNVSPTAVQIQHAGGGPGGQLVNLGGATFMLPAGSIAEYVWDGSWWRQATLQPSAAGGGGGGLDWEGAYGAGVPYVKGDVVTYQGVTYGAVNDSTGQTPPAVQAAPGALPVIPLVTALPASPFDGQEVILTDSLTAPTFTWRFRYVAAKASNKWIYLGGTPRFNEVVANETAPGSTYTALTTPGPIIVVPVAGDYTVEIGFAENTSTTGEACTMSYDIGATPASDLDALQMRTTGPNGDYGRGNIRPRVKSLPAVTLTAKYKGFGSNAQFGNRWMRLTPVAVGG